MSRFTNLVTGAVVSVDDSKDHRFDGSWVRDGEPIRSATPDVSWKVSDLRAFAESNGVDLFDATKKADILAAIELHGDVA